MKWLRNATQHLRPMHPTKAQSTAWPRIREAEKQGLFLDMSVGPHPLLVHSHFAISIGHTTLHVDCSPECNCRTSHSESVLPCDDKLLPACQYGGEKSSCPICCNLFCLNSFNCIEKLMDSHAVASGSTILAIQPLQMRLQASRLSVQLPIHHGHQSQSEYTDSQEKGKRV